MSEHRGHRRIWAGSVLCALLLAGCVTAPTQELSDARRALALARGAGGEARAPSAMRRADAALERAVEAAAAGRSREARAAAREVLGLATSVRELSVGLGALECAMSEKRLAARMRAALVRVEAIVRADGVRVGLAELRRALRSYGLRASPVGGGPGTECSRR